MTYNYSYLVIGSGIAGMSFALKVADKDHRVALICKTTLEEANTALAQGGVASVTNLELDDFDKHIHDTMVAGDWLSDPAAVDMVVKNAPEQIRQLIDWGVSFDRGADGEFDLHREGGHSEFRILHHADNTGFEIQESLIRAVKANPNIDVFTNRFAIEIITQHHLGKIVSRRTPDITCYGAYVLDIESGSVDTFLAAVTVMATGGVGAVYQTTTNPLVATGDGIAMVYRAKGTVSDMEFIQFHPTALFHPGDRPNFLITEAMRGYGGVLRNLRGEEFMHKYDPRPVRGGSLGRLAPPHRLCLRNARYPVLRDGRNTGRARPHLQKTNRHFCRNRPGACEALQKKSARARCGGRAHSNGRSAGRS